MQVQDLIYMFIGSFITLFPVTNPIGNGFIVNGFFQGLSKEDKKIKIRKVVAYCLIIGIATLILGRFILLLFGLNVAVIQLGGGFIICKTGLDLLLDSKTEEEDNTSEAGKQNLQSRLFYPISFPIIMGPGSISVILTLMANASVESSMFATTINYLVVAAAILAIAIVLYICLTQTSSIMRRLGDSGHMIINKLIAFFTFCIGIQITVTGISKIFDISIF